MERVRDVLIEMNFAVTALVVGNAHIAEEDQGVRIIDNFGPILGEIGDQDTVQWLVGLILMLTCKGHCRNVLSVGTGQDQQQHCCKCKQFFHDDFILLINNLL